MFCVKVLLVLNGIRVKDMCGKQCHILLYDTLPESEGSGLSSNVVGDAKGQGILSCGAFPSPLHRSLSNVIGTINELIQM